jgi:hypothetical protein
MSKIIRKHSAKVLTLRNVEDSNGKLRTLHFTLIGGRWHYSGTSEITVMKSDKDGFWKEPIAQILRDSSVFSLKSIKSAFYRGPNKSMQVYLRTWETELSKLAYKHLKSGTPF